MKTRFGYSYEKRLGEELLMNTHNVHFMEKYEKYQYGTFWLKTVPYLEVCHTAH